MNIAVVGLGLIGGSFALSVKELGLANQVIGVDNNSKHREEALRLNIIDKCLELDDAIKISDLILVAIPVNAIVSILPVILDKIDHQIVIDFGSTKFEISKENDQMQKKEMKLINFPKLDVLKPTKVNSFLIAFFKYEKNVRAIIGKKYGYIQRCI